LLQAKNFGRRDKKFLLLVTVTIYSLVLTIVDFVMPVCFESITYGENCDGKIGN